MMDNFTDLNQQVGANNWLIPSRELRDRRLIKRTSRFNVYKADWFGDVLVYENRSNKDHSKTTSSDHKLQLATQHLEQTQHSNLRACKNNKQDAALLIGRDLVELSISTLTKSLSRSQQSLASLCDSGLGSPTANYSPRHCDSAYSSESSSPQYDSKLTCANEFTFPSRLSPSPVANSANQRQCCFNFASSANKDVQLLSPIRVSNLTEQELERDQAKLDRLTTKARQVILNKDSYKFESNNGSDKAAAQHHHQRGGSCWSELNELRLVAHEGFMLFMGAEEAAQSSTTSSLVIQMNHPNSSSLYKLLHGSKLGANIQRSKSTIDRFGFVATNNKHLSICAKLNICQQVTNAMAYLHDKNIVHARLTSANVYLEPNQRVKISLVDEEDQAIISTPVGSVCDSNKTPADQLQFNLPALTYLSPELIKTITLKLDCFEAQPGLELSKRQQFSVRPQVDQSALSKKSDVFSFGTLLFELFEERFPFSSSSPDRASSSDPKPTATCPLVDSRAPPATCNEGQSGSAPPTPHSTTCSSSRASNFKQNGNIKRPACELIYQIGSGQTGARNQTSPRRTPICVEAIIAACWSAEPTQRPQFRQLHFE